LSAFGSLLEMNVYIPSIMLMKADFKAAISNCIATANTDNRSKLDSLLTLKFQTFKKVHILTV